MKKRPNRRFIINSGDPFVCEEEEALSVDFTKELGDLYPDATEDIDASLPELLIEEIEIRVFIDSDHGHVKVTRRSITGLIIFLGRTPIF